MGFKKGFDEYFNIKPWFMNGYVPHITLNLKQYCIF